MRDFRRTIITSPDPEGVAEVIGDYQVMIGAVLTTLIDRFKRNTDYPFIDTKLSMLTGEDFPENPDPARDFKGKTAIYGWIQGRGLEALAGHANWLVRSGLPDEHEHETIDLWGSTVDAMEKIATRINSIRRVNGGHLSFLFSPDGQPFTMDEDGQRRPIEVRDGPWNITDLFCSKGLLAAGAMLRDMADSDPPRPMRDEELFGEARAYFYSVLHAVDSDTLVSDAVSFDPKNRPVQQPGKFFHGSRMLAIGGLALAAEVAPDDEWFAWGEKFVRHVIDRHVNHGQHYIGQHYDLCEAVDAGGQPWNDGWKIISDPGHGCEFVGLAGKFLNLLAHHPEKTASQDRLLSDAREILPRVLVQNFRNGYNQRIGGICKTFDLRSRQPINTDMPWWSLPETLRAAAEMLTLCPDYDATELYDVIAKSSNAFMRNFVNPHIHLMAYQTISAEGEPINVIPATADADPGYHTGLSVINFLFEIQKRL